MRTNRYFQRNGNEDEDELLTFFIPEPTESYDNKIKNKKSNVVSSRILRSSLFNFQSVFILFFSFITGFYIGYDVIFSSSSLSAMTTTAHSSRVNRLYSLKSTKTISNRTSTEMLGQIFKERKLIEGELMNSYGEYYSIFFENDAINKLFEVTESSKNRLIRRLMIKMIQSRLDDHADIQFNWATAGDSAAAGYGNQFSESYTSIIEKTLKHVFQIVGIRFTATNYAMGKVKGSAPELALCMESIYGSDIDILSWDFSSVKDIVGKEHRSSLWVNRAAVHPSNPILFLQDYSSTGRFLNYFNPMETSAGVSTIFLKFEMLYDMKRKLPDVSTNNTDNSNIDHSKLPPAVQYFMCDGISEGDGVRVCSDEDNKHFKCGLKDVNNNICTARKYKDTSCDNIQFRKSWNPGWKAHLLRGKLISLFLLNQLTDALVELDDLLNNDSATRKHYMHRDWGNVLKKLLNIDEHDNNLYQYFPTPRLEWNYFEQGIVDPKAVMSTINEKRSILFRGRSICRTTLLPSNLLPRQRNKKHNHQTSQIMQEDNPFYSFDGGMSSVRLDKPFPIVSESLSSNPTKEEGSNKKCDDSHTDFYNYYDIKYVNKWIGTIFPNATEESIVLRSKLGSRGGNKNDNSISLLNGKEGFILLCFDTTYGDDTTTTSNNKSEQQQHNLTTTDLLHDKIEIKVNKITVVDLLQMDDNCYFLKGFGGYVWNDIAESKRNGKWKFKLLFRVFDPKLKIKMTSIITTFH